MSEPLSDPNARFDRLWRRRHQLDDEEWLAFRQLVHETLRPCRFPELAGLPDDKETCIDDFFIDRIFDPARGNPPWEGKPVSVGYLVTMFRHYLHDRLRDPWRQRRVETDDAPDEAAAEVSLFELLDDQGLTVGSIRQAADDFLAARPPWDELAGELWWIRPYLARHFCADKSEALSALARRLDIPSHHYKAQQLGITVVKGGFPTLDAFRATHLGRWIARLGIDLSGDDAPAQVRIALQLLCQVALYGSAAAAS